MSGITIGLLLIGAIVVAAVLFGLWVVAIVLKFIGRGIAAMFGFSSPAEPLTRPSYPCPRASCRAVNPASARFCRRCGHELLKRQLARQAAMW
jgi:hypothetical protein